MKVYWINYHYAVLEWQLGVGVETIFADRHGTLASWCWTVSSFPFTFMAIFQCHGNIASTSAAHSPASSSCLIAHCMVSFGFQISDSVSSPTSWRDEKQAWWLQPFYKFIISLQYLYVCAKKEIFQLNVRNYRKDVGLKAQHIWARTTDWPGGKRRQPVALLYNCL